MNTIRTVKTHTMHLAGSPAEIFPLLCPVREYEWIEPWRCELVYSDSGVAELDCIFKTRFPKDGPEDIWVVSKYDPPNQIEFVRVNGLRAVRYCINLRQNDENGTAAEWRQVITGLSPEGNELVGKYADDRYYEEMKIIEMMLNHFLSTGTMLKAGTGNPHAKDAT
jgi:hypothetical protein